MHRLIGVFFTCWIGFFSNVCWGQGQLVGTWKNTYGSALVISAQEEGTLEGIYSSSTGSTGKYRVLGTYAPVDENKNLSVVLTVLWNSIDGTTKDPSQFWVSAMVGTYYSANHTMELINLISAAEEFNEVNVLEPSIYPESLTFTKTKKIEDSSLSGSLPQHHPDAKHSADKSRYIKPVFEESTHRYANDDNPLSGSWFNQEENSICSEMTIKFVPDNNTVVAKIVFGDTDIVSIGLIAKPAKKFQTLAMASVASSPLLTDESRILGITGLLDLAKDRLKLVITTSNNVVHKNKYASTEVDVFYFGR